MRRVAQPGPALQPRIVSARGKGVPFGFTLQPGQALLQGVADAFARQGCSSGVLRLRGGALGPFAYVMPALPVSPRNAAYYSDTYRPGQAELHQGAMTLGLRDGAPFFHCHALWREADGRESGGHILPEESTVAAPIAVQAVGLAGCGFESVVDDETNFRLFEPRGGVATGAFHALRMRPNQEIHQALEQFCAERCISRAVLHGGVGSTIGAHYADGRKVEAFATELFITAGEVNPSSIDLAMIDYTGAVSAGRLAYGDNPVLMTMELVLEALG